MYLITYCWICTCRPKRKTLLDFNQRDELSNLWLSIFFPSLASCWGCSNQTTGLTGTMATHKSTTPLVGLKDSFFDICLEVFTKRKNHQICQVAKSLMCVIPLTVWQDVTFSSYSIIIHTDGRSGCQVSSFNCVVFYSPGFCGDLKSE